MIEWCQNKDCCKKKNQNQMRGSKGNKYYQSYKVSKYYYPCCSMGCRHQWFNNNQQAFINAAGITGKQTIGVDDAWEFKSEWNNNYNDTNNRNDYFLINYLMGVRHTLTREQAQTPEQLRETHYGWGTRPSSEAKPLAIQLGLAS